MKNGKWIAITAIIIIAAIGIWWWQSSASDPAQEKIADGLAPEMELMSLDISNINEEKIDAISKIKISNPFPVDINTNRVDYEIYVDSIKVIEDAYDKPLKIASSDNTVIEVPMEILADPLKQVFGYFTEAGVDSADYTLNMNFRVDVPIAGEEEFNMDLSSTMPTFQLTEVELENIDTNLLSSDKGMDIVVSVTNPNSYPIKMRNSAFYLIIEDDLELSGDIDDVINIPAGGTEEVSINVRKERGSITQTGLSFLTDQKGTGFSYHFTYTMESENEIFDGSQVTTNVEGTLDEITDAL